MNEPFAELPGDTNGKRIYPRPFHAGVWCGCEGLPLFIGIKPNAATHPDVRAGTPVKVVAIDLDQGSLDIDTEIAGRNLSIWYGDPATNYYAEAMQALSGATRDLPKATRETCPACGVPGAHLHHTDCPLRGRPHEEQRAAMIAAGPDPIDADDVREAKLDADAFGHIFPEIKLALLVQVLRVLLRTPTIPAPSKRLIAATIDKIGERR